LEAVSAQGLAAGSAQGSAAVLAQELAAGSAAVSAQELAAGSAAVSAHGSAGAMATKVEPALFTNAIRGYGVTYRGGVLDVMIPSHRGKPPPRSLLWGAHP